MKLNFTLFVAALILAASQCQTHAQQLLQDRGAVTAWHTLDADIAAPWQPPNVIVPVAALVQVDEEVSQAADTDLLCYDQTCCKPCWQVFGEFLYLRPGSDGVSYAVPINGAIVPPAGAAPVQIGPEGIADIGFQPGFRAGLGYALSECSNIGGSYTFFESNTTDWIAQGVPYVLRSLVHHPGTANASTDFLQADAISSIDFQLADLEYSRILTSGTSHDLRWLIGARYGTLEQGFQSIFTNATDTEIVASDVDFDGGGIRFGLEGERRAKCSGWRIYAKGNASFLGGEFSGTYAQSDAFAGNVVTAGWTDDRIVSILDAEIGVGYDCCNGCLRFSAGYLVSAWSNVVTTDDFIGSVQINDSSDVSDTLTFDGLTSRVEYRF